MSDHDLSRILDEMEQVLAQDPFPMDAAAIEAWRIRFAEAVASADRGPGWALLVDRAHGIGKRVQTILEDLTLQRDQLRLELDQHAQGSRALRAYRPSGN